MMKMNTDDDQSACLNLDNRSQNQQQFKPIEQHQAYMGDEAEFPESKMSDTIPAQIEGAIGETSAPLQIQPLNLNQDAPIKACTEEVKDVNHHP